MKPFLLLATRDHDEAAAAEYESVRRHAGLDASDLIHIRVESEPMPSLDLAGFSGVMLGGSSFNISDDDKSDVQLRVEADLARLVDRIVDADIPFLGLCYGVGTVTTHLGGDRRQDLFRARRRHHDRAHCGRSRRPVARRRPCPVPGVRGPQGGVQRHSARGHHAGDR